MTRAKDHLHMVVPQRFFAHQQRGNGDRHLYASRTRFIPREIVGMWRYRWPTDVRLSPKSGVKADMPGGSRRARTGLAVPAGNSAAAASTVNLGHVDMARPNRDN